LKDIRITVFDDSADFREGLFHLINMTDNLVLAGAFPDCTSVIKNIEDTAPDVVLMDIDMPGISGIEAVKVIKNDFPELNILMLTVFEDDNKIFEALRAGASGYLLKKTHPSKILDAIQEVLRGGAPMSEAIAKKVVRFFASQNKPSQNESALSLKEKEALKYLVTGHSYKMVAADMHITIETVRSHIKHIYDKLHVNSKTEAVIKAMRDRLV
jgi:DNA-binding NarL/FixJ family response regulator